jgi:uncharacterized membrane protein
MHPVQQAGQGRRNPMLSAFTRFDLIALAFFLLAWLAYHLAMEGERFGAKTLNRRMNQARHAWIEEMQRREIRIVDTQIMGSLRNGTAFFASTSLIAIGGSLAMLQSIEPLLQIFADLPLGERPSRAALEAKIVGLAVIFVYAFFKFGWSYRLFNYAAILIGALPPFDSQDKSGIDHAVARLSAMATAAGTHFNRGQRAFFFALGYLGWFLGPAIFILSTLAVLIVMAARQLRGDGYHALARHERP